MDSQGRHIREYLNKFEAQDAVEYVRFTYGKDMLPYKCKRCNFWHLSPKERHTPSKYCVNCGKQTYINQEDAIIRADIIYQEQGVKLNVYRCYVGSGWHLTKLKINKNKN